jgi:hypothetical protein
MTVCRIRTDSIGLASTATLWTAYTRASINEDAEQQAIALADILQLPNKVLSKLRRAGRGARTSHRIERVVRTRLLDALMGGQYNTRPQQSPRPTASSRSVSPPAPAGPDHIIVDASIARTDDECDGEVNSDAETEHADSDDDDSDSITQMQTEDEERQVQRCNHQMRRRHVKKAARAFNSTTAMADCTQPEVQRQLQEMHPALPSTSHIPPLPAGSREVLLDNTDVSGLKALHLPRYWSNIIIWFCQTQ